MATNGGGGGGGRGGVSREGSAKAMVADQICQAVQSTSNLLHLMQNSSPTQGYLMKLPKNILAKSSTVKNTGQVLDQLPRVISSLDAYMENGLQRLKPISDCFTVLGPQCFLFWRHAIINWCSSSEDCNTIAVKHGKLSTQVIFSSLSV